MSLLLKKGFFFQISVTWKLIYFFVKKPHRAYTGHENLNETVNVFLHKTQNQLASSVKNRVRVSPNRYFSIARRQR